MKQLRRIIMLAAMAAGPAAAISAAQASPTPADSASMAVATVWAHYLAPSLEASYGNPALVADDYVTGISEVLTDERPTPLTRGRVEGLQLANRLAEIESMGIAIDRDVFTATLLAALKGENTGFTNESANAYMESQLQRRNQVDEAFAQTQADFISSNAAREGVVTTPSGLLFETITEGSGAQPVATDRVKVNYTGRLADGTVFDQTKGTPATFVVGNLIPGFTEGLLRMKTGGTYRLIIPASLGYGDRGAGRVIPPGAALDFTVELLEIAE